MHNEPKDIKTHGLPTVLILLATSLMLLAPAIYNGFPLINSDTGSYIRHAFDFQVPADRSPFYGVYVGISSLWSSLWFTISAQAIIVAFLLYRLYCMLSGQQQVNMTGFFIASIMICIGTQAGWITSFAMPDVFASILLMASLLFLFDRNAGKVVRFLYISIIFIAIAVHNSHYLIFFIFTVVLLITSYIIKAKKTRKLLYTLLSVCLLNMLVLASLNFVKGFGFTLSSGSHVFMMAKLAETGILKDYLEHNCDKKQYKLCAYKDQVPGNLSVYLWAEYSPLYKTGGWDSSKKEDIEIIKDVFSTPSYVIRFAKRSIENTFRQLGTISLPEKITPLGEGSSPLKYVTQHLPNERSSYVSSKQYDGELSTGLWPGIHYIFLALSTIAVIIIWKLKKFNRNISGIYLATILFIMCNAFITATLSEVVGRLQYRVSWVFPAINIMIIVQYLAGILQNKKRPDDACHK